MPGDEKVRDYVQALVNSPRMRQDVAFHTLFAGRPPVWGKPGGLPPGILKVLSACGVKRLYSHQQEAVSLIRGGKNVVVATPTASGKTLIYNIAALEGMLAEKGSRALYIFPLKALAQDQKGIFKEAAAAFPGHRPSVEIYDGDTSAYMRRKIRSSPPDLLITNPDMLHLGILPYHDLWAEYLKGVRLVVIDEVHSYRGLLGSHMAMVFRRLTRVLEHYGRNPVFVFSSATIANPSQLAEDLSGRQVKAVLEGGAPTGARHLVFVNSLDSMSRTVILLLKAALHRGLRTIVYTKSRRMAELISVWAGSRAGRFSGRISPYRAGYTPQQRRDIEKRLKSGDLLAVISTSALELGIDIGDLDLCILAGYPGSIAATWQRAGRVGRQRQESAMVLVAGEDALDQYLMRHPDFFLDQQPERAVIDPYNPVVLEQHLPCAAAELPLCLDEPMMKVDEIRSAAMLLESAGALLRSEDGNLWYSPAKLPHRRVNLRGTGPGFEIIDMRSGEKIGEVDALRAMKETHPGAIYLHMGRTYQVKKLDLDDKTVAVKRASVSYYTRVRSSKDTRILEVKKRSRFRSVQVYFGRLEVTEQVTGYEKRDLRNRNRVNIYSLELPPLVFETDGIWLVIPRRIEEECVGNLNHFMGGIHAIEHALLGMMPLFLLADRNDLGGISQPFNAQLSSAAIFLYDGVPGGAGITRGAFEVAGSLLEKTLELIESCECENGCPACVHSPKCGSGNRPIDKKSASFILDALLKEPAFPVEPVMKPGRRTGGLESGKKEPLQSDFCVVDVETRLSASEVGGWHRAEKMGISCAVIYDSKRDLYASFTEEDLQDAFDLLKRSSLVVGFNIKRFDYRVLGAYTRMNLSLLPTLDMLEEVHAHLGYRLSLDHLARHTLGEKKIGTGLDALKWWKEGKMEKIIEYCKKDVRITRDLFLFGRKNGFLLFQNKAGNRVRLPVKW